jgi:hypothetical protein
VTRNVFGTFPAPLRDGEVRLCSLSCGLLTSRADPHSAGFEPASKVSYGARRLVPADTAERPLSGQSGDFSGTRDKREPATLMGRLNSGTNLWRSAPSATTQRAATTRVCRGGGQS